MDAAIASSRKRIKENQRKLACSKEFENGSEGVVHGISYVNEGSLPRYKKGIDNLLPNGTEVPRPYYYY